MGFDDLYASDRRDTTTTFAPAYHVPPLTEKRPSPGLLDARAPQKLSPLQPVDGIRFDLVVNPQGYAWWYIDATSDDGRYGLVIIAFIGSVFSPYYAWSGRGDPFNHCAVNVALYGPRDARWAMTERGRDQIEIGERVYHVGKSRLSWANDCLEINIDEICTPVPRKLKGTVRVHAPWVSERTFFIDRNRRHRWRPIAPASRIEVDMINPGLSWKGEAYLDSNNGDEPLEAGFKYWDWSRTIIDGSKAAITYNTDFADGDSQALSLLFDGQGNVSRFESPPAQYVTPTPVWRIARRTRSEAGTTARVEATMEDTPFYSRSVVSTTLLGKERRTFHESLNCHRLSSPIVKSLLPFRMPRIASNTSYQKSSFDPTS